MNYEPKITIKRIIVCMIISYVKIYTRWLRWKIQYAYAYISVALTFQEHKMLLGAILKTVRVSPIKEALRTFFFVRREKF